MRNALALTVSTLAAIATSLPEPAQARDGWPVVPAELGSPRIGDDWVSRPLQRRPRLQFLSRRLLRRAAGPPSRLRLPAVLPLHGLSRHSANVFLRRRGSVAGRSGWSAQARSASIARPIVLELVFLVDRVRLVPVRGGFPAAERSRDERFARGVGIAPPRPARRPLRPTPLKAGRSGAGSRGASDRRGCDRSDRRWSPAPARW